MSKCITNIHYESSLDEAVEKLNAYVSEYPSPLQAVTAYNNEVKTNVSRSTLSRAMKGSSFNTVMTFLYVFGIIKEKGDS